MISDHQLQQDVLDELEFEPSVEAAHIGVAVRAGVVILSGTVASLAEKTAAEQAARRVTGVRAIAQEIEVRLPSAQKRSDDEIAERALQILKWDSVVPADRIAVKVEKGVVTLAGEVDWQYQKTEAEHDIRKLSGVVGIENLLRVAPSAPAEAVKEKIEDALRRNAELEAAHIAVETDGGKVILKGKVRAWYERDLAAQAAWSVPGVTEVDDKLTMRP